jgi:hypothetical protein
MSIRKLLKNNRHIFIAISVLLLIVLAAYLINLRRQNNDFSRLPVIVQTDSAAQAKLLGSAIKLPTSAQKSCYYLQDEEAVAKGEPSPKKLHCIAYITVSPQTKLSIDQARQLFNGFYASVSAQGFQPNTLAKRDDDRILLYYATDSKNGCNLETDYTSYGEGVTTDIAAGYIGQFKYSLSCDRAASRVPEGYSLDGAPRL